MRTAGLSDSVPDYGASESHGSDGGRSSKRGGSSKKDKRDKADAKAMSKFQKGLVSLGKKLERIAKRYSGTYYGDAASRSYRSFVDSGEQVLQDLR